MTHLPERHHGLRPHHLIHRQRSEKQKSGGDHDTACTREVVPENVTSGGRFLLPPYVVEGKAYVTIGFGCTGGRHRSVVLVEELKRRLEGKPFRIHIKHRDIDK